MGNPNGPEHFCAALDDPFAMEHAAVAAWVEEAMDAANTDHDYGTVDVKELASGAALLAGSPERLKRVVIAAVMQTRHWDEQTDLIRENAQTQMQRMNAHLLPGWRQVWSRRRRTEAVVSTLMRRSLPFDQSDLLIILKWCSSVQNLSTYFAPIGHITRALERYASQHPIDPELRTAIKQFAARLRSSVDKDAQRLGTSVEQIIASDDLEAAQAPDPSIQPVAKPAIAGSPLILDQLKRSLGMLPKAAVPETQTEGPDRFALRNDSPLSLEHRQLTALFGEVVGTPNYSAPDLRTSVAGRAILALDPELLVHVILAAAERHIHTLLHPSSDYQDTAFWQSRSASASVVYHLLQCPFEADRNQAFDILLYLSILPVYRRGDLDHVATRLLATVTHEAARAPLTEGERFVLSLLRASLINGPPLGVDADEVKQLTGLIHDGASFFLVPGEVWTDQVNQFLSKSRVADRLQWLDLIRHALSATTPRPSAKWIKTAEQRIQAIGADKLRDSLCDWLPLVTQGQSVQKFGAYEGDTRGASDTMHVENANCLRGLLWCVPLLPKHESLTRVLTTVALSAYKKVPGVGPRAVKVGNAAVYALAELGSKEAVGQLAMLKVRVKFGTAQKEIAKAFDAAAVALNLPRDQIEELGVPSYGLEQVGKLSEQFGNYRAEILVEGTDARLTWFDATGKALKSVPTKVKSDHKDEFKELQQSLKDIQSMLPAQRDRIDGLFLLHKTWPISEWRDRYHDHPLVGTIAQRLIWCVDGEPAFFLDGHPTDVKGMPITHGQTAEVSLWHPVGRSIPEIIAWRGRLEELQITQPFKQAHREVYVLTDAEQNTRTYSNRFAAHILRQHQFNALCAARGWKNKLRLMVDDTYPPAIKELPHVGLRAEFWIEGIGDDYGTDTNDSGVYLRLASDQVRFYRTGAAVSYAHAGGGGYESTATGPGPENINEPLPLDQVPLLEFSEVMRDVDLFVGVASVGNDPTWQDGGPQGRYREYWQSYSFGELSGTATTRKQVLERLVPRLKIASRCSFSDRFLVVRGDKRTYKIHLGSGNILMEPNDQYLCIVPDSRARSREDELSLPFEGDSTLSIILSKAFLLADDTKIKDPTITRQIGGI